MRVLLVEDNADFAKSVEDAVRPIAECELVWVGSRDSALAKLNAQDYDLVILDRSIPSADGVLDDDLDHGWNVFQFVRSELPGTPVWFLTGTEDADFATELNNDYAKTGDIHGKRIPEQTCQVFWKKSIAGCVRKVRDFAAERAILNRIAIRPDAETRGLKPEENLTLRLFGRRHHGASIDLTSLNGGLSNSRVLKVVVRDASNATLVTAAAKVATQVESNAEAERYQADISRLTPGGFPTLIEKIDVGTGGTGGLFYGMVGEQVESLFHRLANDPAATAAIPADIRAIQKPWYQAKRVEAVQIGRIRRRLIGDAALHDKRSELAGIDIAPIEARTINAAVCCQHGDLHCANVVFVRNDHPMLIDFGDVGVFFSAIDPVILELSTIFHSQHATLPPGWPSEDNMRHWVDASACGR